MEVYVIETSKGSNFGCRYSKKLKGLYLKRISDNVYPYHYGRVEKYNKSGLTTTTESERQKENCNTLLEALADIKEESEETDVFIITERAIPVNTRIPQTITLDIGTFECKDLRTNIADPKKVVGLKGEIDKLNDYYTITALDNIRVFLITLRGSFTITSFTPGKDCPSKIKQFYKKIDWKTSNLWPENASSFEEGYFHNKAI